MYKLYGDGIHDDTLAIQELIDNASSELALPDPEKFYLISAPLELPSNFRLVLPRYAEIRLADNSNCVMLQNKMVEDRQGRTEQTFFDFINKYSPDYPCHDIEVVGGIWNLNNLKQNPNPIYTGIVEPQGYMGFTFLFYNVKNLKISSLTLKDPINFAVTLDTVSYFTVENIVFDFNYGNPLATNMDGIHLNGNCHFGHIRNLQGACYDDLVALNSDEGTCGPITDIDINGIYCEDCHSAVRLLTVRNAIENIHISDVHGTFFQYCIGITKFYNGKTSGYYDGITLDKIYASKAVRLPVYNKTPDSYVYPIIFIENETRIYNIKVADLHRREHITPVSTVFIGENSVIDTLILDNISTKNFTDSDEMPVFVNNGTIKYLDARNIFENGEKIYLS